MWTHRANQNRKTNLLCVCRWKWKLRLSKRIQTNLVSGFLVSVNCSMLLFVLRSRYLVIDGAPFEVVSADKLVFSMSDILIAFFQTRYFISIFFRFLFYLFEHHAHCPCFLRSLAFFCFNSYFPCPLHDGTDRTYLIALCMYFISISNATHFAIAWNWLVSFSLAKCLCLYSELYAAVYGNGK